MVRHPAEIKNYDLLPVILAVAVLLFVILIALPTQMDTIEEVINGKKVEDEAMEEKVQETEPEPTTQEPEPDPKPENPMPLDVKKYEDCIALIEGYNIVSAKDCFKSDYKECSYYFLKAAREEEKGNGNFQRLFSFYNAALNCGNKAMNAGTMQAQDVNLIGQYTEDYQTYNIYLENVFVYKTADVDNLIEKLRKEV